MKQYWCKVLNQEGRVKAREILEGSNDNEAFRRATRPLEERSATLRRIRPSRLSKSGWKNAMWGRSTAISRKVESSPCYCAQHSATGDLVERITCVALDCRGDFADGIEN
jgi:hypothetical protein